MAIPQRLVFFRQESEFLLFTCAWLFNFDFIRTIKAKFLMGYCGSFGIGLGLLFACR